MRMVRDLVIFKFSLAIVAAFLVNPAAASVVGVGNDGNGDCTFGCVARYQQVYRASLFGTGPVTISQVGFFAYQGFTIAPRTFQMTLSTSNFSVGAGLNANYAANLGADQSLFSTTTFSGTYANDDLIAFNGTFSYDPMAGDLLVDIVANVAGGGPSLWASNNPGDYGRATSWTSTVVADYVNPTYGNRTQFVFDAQNNVPEPATLAITLAGLGLLGFTQLRRKQHVTS